VATVACIKGKRGSICSSSRVAIRCSISISREGGGWGMVEAMGGVMAGLAGVPQQAEVQEQQEEEGHQAGEGMDRAEAGAGKGFVCCCLVSCLASQLHDQQGSLEVQPLRGLRATFTMSSP
jgi:hypothetical protein